MPPCTSWARKPWGHENIGQIFVLDLHLFGLQGVGSRQEHIFFSGKQATKEIDREVASSSLVITRLTPPLSSKKGTVSPLFLLVSLVLAASLHQVALRRSAHHR